MTPLDQWLAELGAAAETAASAEQSYRNDFARRVAELADVRAVAFRRANLMRAIADAVSGQEDDQTAVAHGLAVLRTRLGWSEDSEARSEILSRFAAVCEAGFRAENLPEGDDAPSPGEALARFESWYLSAKGTPFWLLFENVIPETPRVDW